MSTAPDLIETFELEMLDSTEAYFRQIDQIVTKNVGALETVGGNILIHVFGVGSRTVVTSGPRKGLYRDVTEEDSIDCAFMIQQYALLHLLEDSDDFDFERALEEEAIVIDGDFSLYEKMMSLGTTQRNALSIRLM